MIGPDGNRTNVKIAKVEATPSRVRVIIDAPEVYFWKLDFLSVSMDFGFRNEPQLTIHGGNTNDGDIARFVAAVEVYADAIKVANNLAEVIKDPVDMFTGYLDLDGDSVMNGLVLGYPDYMLSTFLFTQNIPHVYHRGNEPAKDAAWQLGNESVPIIGLDRLRELARDIAIQAVDRAT